MIRKYLSWGLTLALIAAVIMLIFRGRRVDDKQSSQVVEVVKKSESTATRAWSPRDLKILSSEMLPAEAGDKKQSRSARHEMEIRNNGKVAYARVHLSFEYLGPGTKVLATKTYTAEQIFPPGAAVKISGIKIDNVPVSARVCRVVVAYADLEAAPSSAKQE